jgi:glycosyltransferase involved in cell wall biosynthesis
MKILVSLPVYNEGLLLKRAVNSILDQTHTDFTLVIVNDGSTDNSFSEAEKFLYDSRVVLVNNEKNGGCFYSKNIGLQYMESGEYDVFTTHDADDFSQPTRFEKILNIFNSSNEILAIQDLEFRFGNTPPKWYNTPFTPMVNLAHAFFKKEVFSRIGYFDNTKYSGDEDYWNRTTVFCQNNGKKTYTLEEILYYAEITNDNMILRYDDDLRKQYRDRFWNEIRAMEKTNNFYRAFFSSAEALGY